MDVYYIKTVGGEPSMVFGHQSQSKGGRSVNPMALHNKPRALCNKSKGETS